nr:hypothetical protein [Tanacetum cinerariifolium]
MMQKNVIPKKMRPDNSYRLSTEGDEPYNTYPPSTRGDNTEGMIPCRERTQFDAGGPRTEPLVWPTNCAYPPTIEGDELPPSDTYPPVTEGDEPYIYGSSNHQGK